MSQKSTKIAKEMSEIIPVFLRYMFPYVFGAIDVPPSQVMAMVSIQESGACSLGALKDEMHVSAPTITGIVDRLERDGYVKRIPDENDRRVTNVILTKKGEGIVFQLRENIRKRWEHILSNMPDEVGGTVIETVKKITKGFKDGTI